MDYSGVDLQSHDSLYMLEKDAEIHSYVIVGDIIDIENNKSVFVTCSDGNEFEFCIQDGTLMN